MPEVAEILGVTRQRVHQLIRAYSDFPKPEAELAVGRIWKREAITTWAASHPRKTGRPTTK
jgi:predicted DNA-binding transcriptional regulator AlpA